MMQEDFLERIKNSIHMKTAMAMDDQGFVRSILGDRIEPVTLVVGCETWRGWQYCLPPATTYQARFNQFRAGRKPPALSTLLDEATDINTREFSEFYAQSQIELTDTQDLIAQHWRDCHARNIRLFMTLSEDEINPRERCLAIPGMPVPKIAEYAQVGSGNWAGNGKTETKVNQLLTDLFQRCPFEILEAYSASLEAIFVEPVTHS